MNKFLVAAGVLVLMTLIVAVQGCTIIQGGYVGVKRRFGKIQNEELTSGVHLLIPLVDGVVHVDTKMRSFNVSTEASSRDLQVIKSTVSIQHNIKGDMAAETYEAVGDLDAIDDRIIMPAASEVLKAVTAQYTAEELITKRAEVKEKITEGIKIYIQTTFKNRGLESNVHIDNVAVTDFDFSDEFNASIESKVKAEQEALKAENEKKKRVTEAEASAKEVELKADADAYKIKTESIERADAIKREAEALAQNPHLVKLRAIEKWDGKLPHFQSGNAPIPFLEVPVVAPSLHP